MIEVSEQARFYLQKMLEVTPSFVGPSSASLISPSRDMRPVMAGMSICSGQHLALHQPRQSSRQVGEYARCQALLALSHSL